MSKRLIERRDALLEEADALSQSDLADAELARFEEIQDELEDVERRLTVFRAAQRQGGTGEGFSSGPSFSSPTREASHAGGVVAPGASPT
jgi:hypothetical protein